MGDDHYRPPVSLLYLILSWVLLPSFVHSVVSIFVTAPAIAVRSWNAFKKDGPTCDFFSSRRRNCRALRKNRNTKNWRHFRIFACLASTHTPLEYLWSKCGANLGACLRRGMQLFFIVKWKYRGLILPKGTIQKAIEKKDLWHSLQRVLTYSHQILYHFVNLLIQFH